jgi:hypothetical protein
MYSYFLSLYRASWYQEVFYLPTYALFISVLESFKIYIKIYNKTYIKIAPTCYDHHQGAYIEPS